MDEITLEERKKLAREFGEMVRQDLRAAFADMPAEKIDHIMQRITFQEIMQFNEFAEDGDIEAGQKLLNAVASRPLLQ